jgi:hypothetical protein
MGSPWASGYGHSDWTDYLIIARTKRHRVSRMLAHASYGISMEKT